MTKPKDNSGTDNLLIIITYTSRTQTHHITTNPRSSRIMHLFYTFCILYLLSLYTLNTDSIKL